MVALIVLYYGPALAQNNRLRRTTMVMFVWLSDSRRRRVRSVH
jgi:hypothetical protein